MHLQSISINRFRSVLFAEISDCGGFNVLIGKNNSGKSNILSAANLFFQCLQSGGFISSGQTIISEGDFHASSTNEPVEITLKFILSLIDRDGLISDIVAEAPQMKNAVQGIDTALALRVSLTIPVGTPRYAYFSRMALCPVVQSSAAGTETVLLNIHSAAAKEMFDNVRSGESKLAEVTYFREVQGRIPRLDADDWTRAIRESRVRPGSFGRLLSVDGPPDAVRKLDNAAQQADDYSTFVENLAAMAASAGLEASAAQSAPLRQKIDSFSGEEHSIPTYARRLLASLGELKVLYLTERRSPIGKNEANRLLELKISRGGPEKLRAIQATVADLLGVAIDAFRGKNNPTRRHEPEAELDVDQFLVQLNGAGIREALRLILDYEFGRPDVLLVEEPEIHLHPALETSMMRYLRGISHDCQVLITTHSTNFIDTAEMRNVYLVSKTTSTSVQRVSIEEAEQLIPKELGVRLSSLFMFDRLVFVEGPSDEEVLREWATTLGINLGRANVGFVAMGGVRNFAHYATQNTLDFLRRRNVQLWFVIDRDERDDAEIDGLQTILRDRARLCALERRELENYLVNPRAIAEFIVIKKSLAGEHSALSPSTEEITQALEQAADSLQRETIERRAVRHLCKPHYLDKRGILVAGSDADFILRFNEQAENLVNEVERRKQDVATILDSERTAVERDWGARKLHLVPGDSLLDLVCRKFGTRFNKERDSSRLAALLRSEEIALDIARLLREVSQ